jgi:hypothetical protein
MMKKPNRILTTVLVLITASMLFTGGGLLAFRSGSRSSFSEEIPWKGAVPVALREGTSSDIFISAAVDAGYDRISSRDTQAVSVFSFDGMKDVPISSIPSIYDELDPLYDAFLKKVPSLFEGRIGSSAAEIFYIMTDDGPNKVARRLTDYDDGIEGQYQVVGVGYGAPLILPPVFLILILFMLPSIPAAGRLLFLTGALPLFVISLSGHFAYYPVAVLFPLFWRNLTVHITHIIAERLKRRADVEDQAPALFHSLMRFALFTLASLFFAVLTAEGAPLRTGLVSAAAVLAAPSLGTTFAAFEFLRSMVRQHPKFVPVAMRKHRADRDSLRRFISGRPGRLAMAAVCTGILAMGLGLEARPEHAVRLPLPVDYEAPSEGLFLSTGEDLLPSAGDYYAHRAFHEGYLYGMTFRIPFTGESLGYSDYRFIDGIIHMEPVIVKQFTEQWYEDIMARQAKNGVIGLLLDRTAGTIRYGTTDIYDEMDRAGWKRLVLLVFVAVLTLTAETGIYVSPGKIESESRTVRRKEQAA